MWRKSSPYPKLYAPRVFHSELHSSHNHFGQQPNPPSCCSTFVLMITQNYYKYTSCEFGRLQWLKLSFASCAASCATTMRGRAFNQTLAHLGQIIDYHFMV